MNRTTGAAWVDTERLIVRAPAVEELPAMLDVYLSNPDFLEMTEGNQGEPGRFELETLERELAVAAIIPDRWYGLVSAKATGAIVGVVDWILENDSDGLPWIGLIEIRRDFQGSGFGRELVRGIEDQLRELQASVVRAAVIERNGAGCEFMKRVGYEVIGRRNIRLVTEEPILVLEHTLA